MKKFVIFSLFALLILAFGATVYGQEKPPVVEFKASGWIDVITHYKMNSPYPGSGDTKQNNFFGPAVDTPFQPDGGAFDKYEGYVENRGRLKLDAILGKEMTGTFQFEIDSSRWGERAPSGAQRNYAGHWDTDRAAVEVKHMYMTFGMPWVPVPITVQAGLGPVGVRSRVMFSNDGPGVTAAIKVDPAMIKLLWYKQIENEDWAGDDNDVYGGEVSAKIENMTVGAYGLYFNLRTYPFQSVTLTDPNGASSVEAVTSTVNYRGNMKFFGVYLDGKVGPANLSLDIGLDNGKIEDHRDSATLAKDVDYSGWMTRLEASVPWEKFTFGLVGVYGTGADAKKASANGRPGVTVGHGGSPYTAVASKVGAFALTPADNNGPGDLFIVNGDPNFIRGNTGLYGAASGAMSRSMFGGLWYLKLYGAMAVTDVDKLTLGAAYIGDTTKNGNTIGNARKTDGYLRDDKSIGFEFDILNQLSIYKNLTFDVGFGYLVAGKAVDYYKVSTGSNESPKNPWILGTRLLYSF